MSPSRSCALRNASVKVATRHAVKTRHTSCGDQWDAASSSTKSTPPTGAPKAAAIPAPAPAQMNSRRSRSLCRRSSTPAPRRARVAPPLLPPPGAAPRRQLSISRRRFSPRVSPDATPAPMWIIGASCPHAIALDTEKMVPTTLTKMQRRRRKLRTCVPFRYALISGIPPAAAAGSK